MSQHRECHLPSIILPPCPISDLFAFCDTSAVSLEPLGTVTKIQKTTSGEDEAADDQVPLISEDDHLKYIKGRKDWQGITTRELSKGSVLFSRDAYIAVITFKRSRRSKG